ncbi:hypothetical protein A0H81_04746 [Grifola frondosa]|uniref:Uncharacterized protein n=1 Tax=Grifola frondosa TaxID=5627 RepID=A0A1C7MEY5_GRIFR|nr:hypothetical protein A0H81_04746 [Grifola frondosa]
MLCSLELSFSINDHFRVSKSSDEAALTPVWVIPAFKRQPHLTNLTSPHDILIRLHASLRKQSSTLRPPLLSLHGVRSRVRLPQTSRPTPYVVQVMPLIRHPSASEDKFGRFPRTGEH